MSKPHLILLGDRTQAARWVGYAKGQFELQVERYGPNFQTAIQPRRDVLVEMRMFGGVRKIIITVRPPVGAAFAGVPYDTSRYSGWGSPYQSKDEFGNAQAITSKGIPYGTEFSTTDSPVVLDSGRKLTWVPSRYPQYASNYPELKYGTIDWLSDNRNVCVTWDGTNSRHKYTVPNEDDVFHGYSEGSCESNLNEGLMYIGQVFTKGALCEPAVNFEEGVYRITGVSEGAGQTIGDYDYVSAVSGNVYKDGDILWTAPDDRIVTAACMVYRPNSDAVRYRELRVVLGDYDAYRGVTKEYLLLINLDEETTLLEQELDTYGNEDVPLVSGNVDYLHPYENINNGSFRSDGTKLLLLRDFISDNGVSWQRTTRVTEFTIETDDPEDDNYTPGTLSGISLTPEDISATKNVLWDNRTTSGAPKVTKVEREDNLPDATWYKAHIEGDYVVAVDYKAKAVVYAYINTYQTEEVTQTLTKPGACNEYVSKQITSAYEYLYFTVNPKHIFLRDSQIIRDTRINTDLDPDYLYRKTYTRWKIPTIFSIDARYAAAVIVNSVSNAWWQLRAAQDGGSEGLIKYEPFEQITQDFNISVYLNGDEIHKTGTLQTVISFSFSSTVPQYFSCLMTLGIFDPYDVGDVAFTWSATEHVLFAHWQLVTRRIDENNVDMLVSGRWNRYGFNTLSYIFRYNETDDTIIRQEQLPERLEIAEYYNTEDDELLSIEGCYSNVGLI